MKYEDRQYKISRDRLAWLLRVEYEEDKQESLRREPHLKIPPFNLEAELAKYEELPSNDKEIVKITYLK